MVRHSLVLALLLAAGATTSRGQAPASFPIEELTVAQLQDAMATGKYTARRLV